MLSTYLASRASFSYQWLELYTTLIAIQIYFTNGYIILHHEQCSSNICTYHRYWRGPTPLFIHIHMSTGHCPVSDVTLTITQLDQLNYSYSIFLKYIPVIIFEISNNNIYNFLNILLQILM